MLTNDNFTINPFECESIRTKLEAMTVDLISIIVRNVTKAFHNASSSTQLFNCLYGEGINATLTDSLYFVDEMQDLSPFSNPDLYLEILLRICSGPPTSGKLPFFTLNFFLLICDT